MKVNIQYAETHLADLISAADNGEPVEIARPDKPALRFVVSNEPYPSVLTKRLTSGGRGGIDHAAYGRGMGCHGQQIEEEC